MNKKDIQLCGLGNALLDFQINVSFEELEQLNLNKGEMRLVDSKTQSEILQSFGNKEYHKCSGGSAANTIIAFTKFGGSSAYMTALGNDENGRFYSNEFKEIGIELFAHNIEDEPTGTCLVLITPDAERTMLTCLGASAKFGKEHIHEEIIRRSEWLYVEGYKFSQESSTEAVYLAIDLADKHNTKIAVTFSDVFITEYFYNNIKEVVNQANLIFCNEAEAMSFTKTNNFDDAATALGNLCPNVVITRGKLGSQITWSQKHYNIPAYKTNSIDTTGAGDMYAAGFLYGITHTDFPELSGNLASYASSKVVAQLGARLKENHVEVRDFIVGNF